MNRYQKPEVYEQLAMEYSLGTLHGRARKRFELLMQKHPYLQAIVEEHDLKLAKLVAFLPDTKPDDRVWENIHLAINQSEPAPQTRYVDSMGDVAVSTSGSWWQTLTQPLIHPGSGYKGLMTAMLVLVLSSVLLLKIGSVPETTRYTATLISEVSKQPMIDVLVAKNNMKMTIHMKESVPVPEGMRMVFWCIAKDQTKPIMNMGTVAAQGMTEKKLKQASWQGIVDASKFAVSIEPEAGSNNARPSGDLLFVGQLKALTKT